MLSALKAGRTEEAGAGRIPAGVLGGRGQPRPTGSLTETTTHSAL